jgi:ATP-dependent DNA helicase PIF1
MVEQYHDALVLARVFGKPDLFITMTCNPNWREIREHLLPHESPRDRPDSMTYVNSRSITLSIDYQ